MGFIGHENPGVEIPYGQPYKEEIGYFWCYNPEPVLKKSQAFILLLLCSIPYLFIAVFQIRQSTVRLKMKERLEEKILHSVTISEKELVWVKPGKEIYLDGKMFDIKSIRTENGICHITGLFDEEESFLVKQLEKARGSGEFSSHQWLVQFLQLFQSEVPDDLHQQMIATGNNRENELNENLTTIFLAIIFPPPQVV